MVVFTCGHCGESVQKPKVEKHYLTKCRNKNPNLSCMDCFKDFFGQDYEVHNKCITEEERYSGKGFQAKEKKGEKKQNAWVEMLPSVLDEQKSAPPNVLRIIETISKHQNTPRKKPKFINFVKNVCGPKTNQKDVDQAWELISVKLSALSNVNNQRGKAQNKKDESEPITNGNTDTKDSVEEHESNDVPNGNVPHENDEADEKKLENGESENVSDKKLSKKQRKEEKKRQKYEAELQSAVVQPAEEEEETQATSKKGKKKKNRTESLKSVNDEEEVQSEGKNKHKKRKRQDTVNGAVEVEAPDAENIENVPINKEKLQKKKLKIDGAEAADESLCLHDQNVAKSEEVTEVKGDTFNWHDVILSVLNKKDNEMPFKRLQKKVLSEYSEMTGREVDDRIADKFIKKLKSAPKVRVDKNRVYIEE